MYDIRLLVPMKRVLRLAVVIGGVGALVWSLRNRVRIAVGRNADGALDFEMVGPDSESPPEETATDPQAGADAEPPSDEDPPSHQGASDGTG